MSAAPIVTTAALAALFCGMSRAEEADIALLIEGRQSNYRDIGSAYKAIGDELKKSKPRFTMMQQYADQLSRLARQQSEQNWFPQGTGPEAQAKTAAKPEIWSKPETFQKWREALANEAEALMQLTSAPAPAAALKAQHEVLGEACAGCHKLYREEED